MSGLWLINTAGIFLTVLAPLRLLMLHWCCFTNGDSGDWSIVFMKTINDILDYFDKNKIDFLKYYWYNGIKTNNDGLIWFNRWNPLKIMDLKQKQKIKMQTTIIDIEKERLCARIYIALFFSCFVCGATHNIFIFLYFASFNCINHCWDEYVTTDDTNSNVLNNNKNKLCNVKKKKWFDIFCGVGYLCIVSDRWK